MRKQNAMVASKDSLLFPRVASAGLEKSLQLMWRGGYYLFVLERILALNRRVN